jgi:Acetyltransferase (GNAT) family.
MIRDLHASDAGACDAIVAGLPDWFGNEGGIRECAEAVRTQAGLVADRDGRVAGFLTYATVAPGEAEITWMAVDSAARRTGMGSALIAELVARLERAGVTSLLVKTLSDREDPGPAYSQTRAFYLAMEFVPGAELDIWGPENPAQLLVKTL